MPLYSYECGNCGKVFETLEKTADKKSRVCPACGGEAERRLSIPAKPAITGGNPGSCCGEEGGCENPKRCCGR